jgi:16S rRNA (cytosine967-C5)-methyltransferase
VTVLPESIQSPSARQTALQILYAIDVQGAYTDVVLRQALGNSTLERRERAFVTECVYGVIRWRGRLDWLLMHACRRPLDTLTPWIHNILRLGLYQCLWMQRVPPWAAVNEAVKLARRFGHQGTARLVNGVLRTLLRRSSCYPLPDATTQPVAHLAIAFSHPEWLVARWFERYGWERTLALCDTNNRPCGITLRTNTLRTTPPLLAQRLRQERLQQVTPSGHAPDALVVQGTARLDALSSYAEGLFQVQDAGAMLVAPLCQVKPGQRVLDTCAAPGGKTTHVAQLMHDTGRIIACDVQPGRLRLLRRNAARLQMTSIVPILADATRPLPVQDRFDCVLVDAPCSGLAVLRRHPDIKWRRTPADLEKTQAMQLRMLQAQYQLLAPDGVMVYSVCSNEPEETHDVVQLFLTTHPCMRLDSIDGELRRRPLWPSATAGTLDLTPEQWHTDGVFVARFRRRDATV